MAGCRPLTSEEVELVSKSFGGKFALRDRALFIVGTYSGFRITELLSLQLRDVYQHGHIVDRVSVQCRNMKGSQQGRSVVLHDYAKLALLEWITVVPKFFELRPDLYVFQSRQQNVEQGRNCPLSRVQAWNILKEAFNSCELTGNLGTHTMRKTFAQNIHARLGNDLFLTKQALGQKSIQSTIAYMELQQDVGKHKVNKILMTMSPINLNLLQ